MQTGLDAAQATPDAMQAASDTVQATLDTTQATPDAMQGTLDAMRAAFDAMHAASRADPAVAWPLRRDRLARLRALVLGRLDAFADAISADFGHRPAAETRLLEGFPSLKGIDHALRHGAAWSRPRRRATGVLFRPGRSLLWPQPLGVAGIVVPWNYPLYLAVGPLTSALAAGNRAMIKMSEATPRLAAAFGEAVREAFAADEVAVIEGDAGVARAFCALPFDHLLFTGSTAVGHDVMRAASEHLTPVTLELGGKSPAIVGPGADFGRAVDRIMAGKLVNAGQTCIAPDYVLVPQGSQDRFVEAARDAVARRYPRLADTPDYASIAGQRHLDRLLGLVDAAVAAGATCTWLASAEGSPYPRRLAPAALTGVDDSMAVMRQEIFGPLLPVRGYRTVDDAIAQVNARPRPLALYVFDRDRATIDAVLSRTVAGGVTVNDTLLHIAQDDLPFGGVGASGMGSYHGQAGFETFSAMKPVFRQARFNGAGLLDPPYGARFERLLGMLLPRRG